MRTDSESDLLGIKGFLVDLDGVLYVGDEVIAGAADALRSIKDAGYPIRGVTNTTTKSAATLASRLQSLNLPLGRDEIVTAPRLAARYLRARGHPKVRLVLSDDAAREFEEFEEVLDRPEAIVIGDIGENWDYALMTELFNALVSGAELIALHKGRYYQGPDGLVLDIGAFVSGLEYAAGVEAVVVGKPSRRFFHIAVESMGIEPERAVMVGDDIESDVGGAQAAGLKGFLVRTGKFREHLVRSSSVEPDAILDSIADLPTLLRSASRG